MKDEKLLLLLNEKKVECRVLQIAKRRISLMHDYLKGENARKYVGKINSMIYFYSNFETRFEIKKGEVFVVSFEFMCGNEVNGPHFCAALLDSSPNSQVVTVVPLISRKEGKELNPASQVLLGQIPGVGNGKEAVAVINQIRTIDKRRLFDKAAIEHLNHHISSDLVKDYQPINAQNKYIYRLSDEQYEKMHKAMQQYVWNGYIKHA